MATPMQKQYDKLKKKHSDCILLFRLGDFYECFDNDAKIISKVLGIVLTKRGKGANARPMAGIPHHALDNYLPKLVNAGYKLAIAEQLEEPQKGKKVVDRDVVKIVTAGTITNEKSLSENKNNFIVSLSKIKQKKDNIIGLAISDLTTGEFYISQYYNLTQVIDEVKRNKPAEILLNKNMKSNLKNLDFARLQVVEDYKFNLKDNKNTLKKHFKTKNLKGFGIEKYKAGIISAGILIDYLIDTQKTPLNHINKIFYKDNSDYMLLDENTIRSLELISTIRDDSSATLLSILDECKTSMGKRKLFNWLINPLKKVSDIEKRIEAVDEFFNESINLEKIINLLDRVYDIERILGKIGTQSVNAKDLIALKDSLNQISKIITQLKSFKSKSISNIYKTLSNSKDTKKVIKLIKKSIIDDPPVTIMEGGIIKDNYDDKLDKLRKALKGGKDWLKKLQKQEIEKTRISSLKVKFNKVFGYYIEVTKSNLSKVPDSYIRKQTLVNAERFITPELKEKEEAILNAEENSQELEYEIFTKIREKISEYIPQIQLVADYISILDCLTNFASLARRNEYTKPQICKDDKKIINIENGRHPVVEKINEEEFIPNDTNLNCKNKQIAIITGPNMAGKSTYIRQVALITLMAQIGSFVPASKMKFKPVDKIFTRVGSQDNLAGGESTFLIEMNETANILNNATKDSLIILDEVGRGTSTYDGVAIAWAVAEYIHEKIGAKTLFATHYHELVDLEKYLSKVINLNVAVDESHDKIIFVRKIEKGSTDKSYGVHVAGLAGIPSEVIQKAKEILLSLEQEGLFEVKHVESELTEKKDTRPVQMGFKMKLPENPIMKELKELDVNKMTPIEALKMLDEIVRKLKEKK